MGRDDLNSVFIKCTLDVDMKRSEGWSERVVWSTEGRGSFFSPGVQKTRSSTLKADSQTERITGNVLPEAIPSHQADAGDEDRVGADVDLQTAAERAEMVEPQDVVLIPEII